MADDDMSISPAPAHFGGRSSSTGTPASHLAKRLRGDADYMDLLAEENLNCSNKRPQSHDGSHHSRAECSTPVHSPGRGSMANTTPAGGYGTPLAGFANERASLADCIGIRWGCQQRQGPRSTQEDAVSCRVDTRGFDHGFFGVFDGHGGAVASEHAALRLHDNVLGSNHFPADCLSALQDGFLRTDAELLRKSAAPPRRKDDDCGAAAACVMVTHDAIAVAHAGDCRVLLVKRSSAGDGPSFVALTNDHSAERIPHPDGSGLTDGWQRPDEVRRVVSAGGRMDEGGYVCVGDHSLPMTRALGDLPLKVLHLAQATWDPPRPGHTPLARATHTPGPSQTHPWPKPDTPRPEHIRSPQSLPMACRPGHPPLTSRPIPQSLSRWRATRTGAVAPSTSRW